MGVGAFGLGITLDGASTVVPLGGNETTGFGYWNSSGGGVFPGQWQVGLNIKGGGAVGGQFILNAYAASPRAMIRCRNSTNPNAWAAAELYTTANTTKSSDGTLKAASPVVKVFSDGSYQNNEESEGCTVTRLATGEYLVEGCEGLNADAAWGGWDGGFDIPTDRNKQPLIWLDYEVNADGSVLVKTYHRTHPEAPAFARNELQGINDAEPVDIPHDQFVSVRVEMPADSLYRQRMRAAELAITADQGE